jgi:predicted site-specific integrase-resolvase
MHGVDKMSNYSIGQFSKKIGVTAQTLRNWDKNGELKPIYVSEGGTRYYSEEQKNQFLGIKGIKCPERITIGYCRVNSNKQKDELEHQIENVKMYMFAKGYQFEIIQDIGNGINYEKKGLNKLINQITNSEIDRVVILYKDRLVRFGFEIIENLCRKYGTEIEIIDNTEKIEEQELIEDLVQIVSDFSSKFKTKHASEAKNFIKELLSDDNSRENYRI